MKKAVLFVLFCSLLLRSNNLFAVENLTSSTVAVNTEIQELYSRLFQDYYQNSVSDTQFYQTQLANGSWSNIDYANRSITYWPVMNHLYRLHAMAKLFCEQTDKNSILSNKLLNGIKNGIAFWQTSKPASDNWFYNDIGKQVEFMAILILMRDYLPTNTINDICTYFTIAPANNTGANLIEMASSVLVKGVLQKDTSLISFAVKKIQTLLEIVPKGTDGIQSDKTFLFHGLQLFSVSYNISIFRAASLWMNMTKGLSFAFPEKYIKTMREVILEGNRWFYYGDVVDFNTVGRKVSQIGGTTSTAINLTLNRMKTLDIDSQSDYQTMLDNIKENRKDTLTGNRAFFRADCMVQRHPNYYFSVKMCSSRTSGTECGNNENLKGFWLPFGSTCFMRDGAEFKNTFALWDWTKVPGVTCTEETPTFGWSINQSSTFVGGVSDGLTGVCTMQLNKQSLLAKKSWFLFGDEIVALGCGITSTNPKTVSTSLAQSKLRGKILLNGLEIKSGTAINYTKVKSIYHDSVCYVFPKETTVRITNNLKTGNWHTINLSQPDSVVTDSVFNCWINHGIKPIDSTYAYIVLPYIKPQALPDYVNHLPVNILSNTSIVQAVTHTDKKLTGAVFHAGGALVIDQNLTIKVFQPCALLLDQSVDPIKITVSGPSQENTSAMVQLIYPGNQKELLDIALPTGNLSGSSVMVRAKTNLTTESAILTDNPEVKIYPNPVKDMLTISGLKKPVTATIYSIEGQKVLEQNNGNKMDLSTLKTGIYILKVGENKPLRLIKN